MVIANRLGRFPLRSRKNFATTKTDGQGHFETFLEVQPHSREPASCFKKIAMPRLLFRSLVVFLFRLKPPMIQWLRLPVC
jgi:hypothetical protein